MRIRHELVYPAAPAEVYAMRADPEFRSRVCAAMGTATCDVTVAHSADELTIAVDMLQQTRDLPAFARGIVGDRTRVIQTERWPAVEGGHIDVAIPGKPGHIRGTLSLTGRGEASVYVFDGEATINVPLVGGRLEGLIERLFVDGMDTEQRVAVTWLEGEGR